MRPEKHKPKHLLWSLYLLKIYQWEGPGCTAIGESKGAINPKTTMQKWVSLQLECITKLADHMASLFLFHNLAGHHLTSLHGPFSLAKPHQIVFKIHFKYGIGNDCLMTINGTNFHILQKGVTNKVPISMVASPCSYRSLACTFLSGI